jgi:hypothetical protein
MDAGESLGKEVSELAREDLKPRESLRMVKKGRFYQVDVPADTPKIDPELVQRFLDDEGAF